MVKSPDGAVLDHLSNNECVDFASNSKQRTKYVTTHYTGWPCNQGHSANSIHQFKESPLSLPRSPSRLRFSLKKILTVKAKHHELK